MWLKLWRTDPRKTIQHYEKLKIADAVDFDDALKKFEVLYKQGLAESTPCQLSKLRDELVGNSKIETALSKLEGGTVVKPPKLVVTGLAIAGRSDILIRRLVHSNIVSSIVPRAGVLVCIKGPVDRRDAGYSEVFIDEESSSKLLDLLKTAPGILGTAKAFKEALECIGADKEVERSGNMPLLDVPYEVGEKESADLEDLAKRLARELQDAKDLVEKPLQAHEAVKAPKMSLVDADTPGTSESKKVAEQGKLAKDEADKLVDLANKQVIYDRIDQCVDGYGSGSRSFTSTTSWGSQGKTKVRGVVTAAAQDKAARGTAKRTAGKGEGSFVPGADAVFCHGGLAARDEQARDQASARRVASGYVRHGNAFAWSRCGPGP